MVYNHGLSLRLWSAFAHWRTEGLGYVRRQFRIMAEKLWILAPREESPSTCDGVSPALNLVEGESPLLRPLNGQPEMLGADRPGDGQSGHGRKSAPSGHSPGSADQQLAHAVSGRLGGERAFAACSLKVRSDNCLDAGEACVDRPDPAFALVASANGRTSVRRNG